MRHHGAPLPPRYNVILLSQASKKVAIILSIRNPLKAIYINIVLAGAGVRTIFNNKHVHHLLFEKGRNILSLNRTLRPVMGDG